MNKRMIILLVLLASFAGIYALCLAQDAMIMSAAKPAVPAKATTDPIPPVPPLPIKVRPSPAKLPDIEVLLKGEAPLPAAEESAEREVCDERLPVEIIEECAECPECDECPECEECSECEECPECEGCEECDWEDGCEGCEESDWEEECADWDDECSEWEMECADWDDECSEWEMECADWDDECSDWEDRCAEWEEECQAWQERCAEWEALCDEHEDRFDGREDVQVFHDGDGRFERIILRDGEVIDASTGEVCTLDELDPGTMERIHVLKDGNPAYLVTRDHDGDDGEEEERILRFGDPDKGRLEEQVVQESRHDKARAERRARARAEQRAEQRARASTRASARGVARRAEQAVREEVIKLRGGRPERSADVRFFNPKKRKAQFELQAQARGKDKAEAARLEDLQRKMKHYQTAAENLEAVGESDQAENLYRIARALEKQRQELTTRRERDRRRVMERAPETDEKPVKALHEALEDLRDQVRDLHKIMNALREEMEDMDHGIGVQADEIRFFPEAAKFPKPVKHAKTVIALLAPQLEKRELDGLYRIGVGSGVGRVMVEEACPDACTMPSRIEVRGNGIYEIKSAPACAKTLHVVAPDAPDHEDVRFIPKRREVRTIDI